MDFKNINPTEMTPEQSKAWSANVIGLLEDGSDASVKQASISMDEYVRPFNREMDFVNRIIEPEGWDENDRVPALDHDHPMMYVEVEPASPGAMMIDFGYQANTFYPSGQRMPLVIQQVQTERVIKEIIELGAYRYRFRQALTDLQSLQLAALRDKRFMDGVRAMLGDVGVNLPYSGKPNNVDYGQNLDYPSWLKFTDQMEEHPNKLKTATVLCNSLSLKYIRGMLVGTFTGTQLAEDVWKKSFEEIFLENQGITIIATIKDALVAKSEYFGFAAQNRLGKYVQMMEPTMHVKNEGMHISFSQIEALGMALVNPTGLGRGVFSDN